MNLYAVVKGKKKNLEDVNDEAFAEKMLGDGIAIVPTSGDVCSPIDAEVAMVFPTNHAIGLKTKEGVEILLHIGIDTVEMNGEGFTSYVKQGEEVRQGEPLITFDVDLVKEKGYEPDVMVIITAAANYPTLEKTTNDYVTLNDVLLHLE